MIVLFFCGSSHNRIGTEGAIAIAMGLKENTCYLLQISYNPMQGAGCYGVLKVLQDNPKTAMESLDFSVTVSRNPIVSRLADRFPGVIKKQFGPSIHDCVWDTTVRNCLPHFSHKIQSLYNIFCEVH
uniref:Uncharacterized protein n=1 Tax=Callorhinchus milii TaxID=7868 RepID=A0A4W3ISZ3_CALMI